MNNLFSFSYETSSIENKDGSESRFGIVYGQEGKVIHTKKDTYHVVTTEALSSLGNAFVDQGYDVKPFVHRAGEVIGLNITFGKRATKVGDKTYNAIITVPNNGGGKGYLALRETRLICTNGMVHQISGSKGVIKIPHTIDYNYAIELMKSSLVEFKEIMQISEAKDADLNKAELTKSEATRMLNAWYYEKEMPSGHKEDMTFEDFRKALYENTASIKSYDRYKQLKQAFTKEVSYNEQLELKLSKYTVFASVTNYLSRRIEASQSAAPVEVQYERSSKKVESFAF